MLFGKGIKVASRVCPVPQDQLFLAEPQMLLQITWFPKMFESDLLQPWDDHKTCSYLGAKVLFWQQRYLGKMYVLEKLHVTFAVMHPESFQDNDILFLEIHLPVSSTSRGELSMKEKKEVEFEIQPLQMDWDNILRLYVIASQHLILVHRFLSWHTFDHLLLSLGAKKIWKVPEWGKLTKMKASTKVWLFQGGCLSWDNFPLQTLYFFRFIFFHLSLTLELLS